MTATTQPGYLVLADISGFTAYLAGVELDHAHEILTDLLETIVRSFVPLLTLSKLEGDAVFAYAPEARLPRGESLLEIIEATYVAFRGRLEATHRRTTCECNACKSIPKLDLKFVAHHGNYIIQQVAGAAELLGSDVNLAHRLMKNHVSETTGWRAYSLFTEACLQHLGCQPEGMHAQAETYEHLGETFTRSLNLHTRYQELTDARRVLVTQAEAYWSLTREYPLAPPILWEWLNDPHKIIRWSPHRDMRPGTRPQGRMSTGARNHCMHGKEQSMIETVLDWRPFDYFTVVQESKMLPLDFLGTTQLTPTPNGTCLQVNMRAKFRLPLPEALKPQALRWVVKMFGMDQDYETLAQLIAAEQKAPA